MKAWPALSVVIPSRQRVDLLRRCLRSVIRHAPPRTEIIVVDDASEDSSVCRATHEFRGVRVVRLRRPAGFCVAANLGVRLAHHPIVQLLNDDTEVAPGWATSALAAFDDPGVASVAPLVMLHPESAGVIDSAGDMYDRGGFAWKRGHGKPLNAEYLRPAEVDSASGCAAFYRRAAFLAAGGFAESFGAYFEDVDLGHRLRRFAGRTVYAPRSRVIHHGSSSYGQATGPLLERQSCNEERLFWRHQTGSTADVARHLVVLAGKLARRLREGTASPWLLGRLRAWALAPIDVWQTR